jgi:hypothetical protein
MQLAPLDINTIHNRVSSPRKSARVIELTKFDTFENQENENNEIKKKSLNKKIEKIGTGSCSIEAVKMPVPIRMKRKAEAVMCATNNEEITQRKRNGRPTSGSVPSREVDENKTSDVKN